MPEACAFHFSEYILAKPVTFCNYARGLPDIAPAYEEPSRSGSHFWQSCQVQPNSAGVKHPGSGSADHQAWRGKGLHQPCCSPCWSCCGTSCWPCSPQESTGWALGGLGESWLHPPLHPSSWQFRFAEWRVAWQAWQSLPWQSSTLPQPKSCLLPGNPTSTTIWLLVTNVSTSEGPAKHPTPRNYIPLSPKNRTYAFPKQTQTTGQSQEARSQTWNWVL